MVEAAVIPLVNLCDANAATAKTNRRGCTLALPKENDSVSHTVIALFYAETKD